jgi:LemA protein
MIQAIFGLITICLAIIVIFGVVSVGIYNSLITLRNRYKNAFSQIDVQLKRRYDLIPNLVETVKGYLDHERETLQGVIAARNQAAQANSTAASDPGNAGAMRSLSGAEGALGGMLTKLLAVVESYPDLKGNHTIAEMMEELRSTENRIGFARQAFNDAVMRYNIAREKFPHVIVASITNFQRAEFFELTNVEERQTPKVSFSN